MPAHSFYNLYNLYNIQSKQLHCMPYGNRRTNGIIKFVDIVVVAFALLLFDQFKFTLNLAG